MCETDTSHFVNQTDFPTADSSFDQAPKILDKETQ